MAGKRGGASRFPSDRAWNGNEIDEPVDRRSFESESRETISSPPSTKIHRKQKTGLLIEVPVSLSLSLSLFLHAWRAVAINLAGLETRYLSYPLRSNGE